MQISLVLAQGNTLSCTDHDMSSPTYNLDLDMDMDESVDPQIADMFYPTLEEAQAALNNVGMSLERSELR